MSEIVHDFSRGFVMRVDSESEARWLEYQQWLKVKAPTWLTPGWYRVILVTKAPIGYLGWFVQYERGPKPSRWWRVMHWVLTRG